MMIQASCMQTEGGYLECAPEVVAPRLGAVRVIDVREPDEFYGELGHIKDSELIPLAIVGAEALHWDRAQPLLLVCRSGKRAGRAAQMLCQMGFQQVKNLSGGMLAWREAERLGLL